MLLPVSAYDELPTDVTKFADELRQSAPTPTIVVGAPLTDRLEFLAPPRPVTGHVSMGNESWADLLPSPPASGTTSVQDQPPKLDHWTIQAHVYTKDIAARVGLLMGLFSGSARTISAGAINEAKRFRLAKTEAGTEIEIGVAVRLVVATTNWEVNAEISIPNIAAAAQLKLKTGDARIGIEVAGYSGALGDLLPAPRQLDVTALSDYLTAFTRIQAAVFGDSGLAFQTPTVLSVNQPLDG